MKKSCSVLLCALFVAPAAFACGMTSKLVPLERPAGDFIESVELPAPVAVVTSVVRGIGPRHSSCDDTGLLSVLIEWPKNKVKLRDVGFEFKIVGGTTTYAIFPGLPVQAPIDGKRSDFLFMWREGGPAQQSAIDLRVEVRAVTRENERGPPAVIQVKAAPGA